MSNATGSSAIPCFCRAWRTQSGFFGLRLRFKKKETVKTVHLSWRSEDGASDADWAGEADTNGKLVARWDLLLREVTLSG